MFFPGDYYQFLHVFIVILHVPISSLFILRRYCLLLFIFEPPQVSGPKLYYLIEPPFASGPILYYRGINW